MRSGRISGRLAMAALVVLLLAGIWVFVAPFAVGLQPSFSPWSTATRNALVTGGVLMVTALGGLITYGALGVRELLARAPQLEEAPEGDTKEPGVS
ncbi:MAG: hypothetical protein DLM54_05800 [Acidimicrobiales bacterium]|nr:MAG: hypothetical protein DLM54_05800 [Acidimicrobiales bacterium]